MPRSSPTHFLALPLSTPTSRPQLAKALADFRLRTSHRPGNDLSETSQPQNIVPQIPDGVYRPLGTIHLTLGVMRLGTSEKLNAAVALLQDLDLERFLRYAEPGQAQHLPQPQPQPQASHPSSNLESLARAITPPRLIRSTSALKISLRGLDAFPSTSQATVLYARPHDPTRRISPFSVAVRQTFIDAGFVEAEKQGFTLHATVANTVCAQQEGRRRRGNGRRKVTMDVRDLIAVYSGGSRMDGNAEGEYVWAEDVLVDRVRICKMGAKQVEDQELGMEYEVIAEKMM